MLEQLPPAPVRAGWTLPAGLVGLLAASAGGWLVHSLATTSVVCELSVALDSIGGDGHGHPAIACGRVNLLYNAGGALVASGALLALVALLVAGRRGRAASRHGHPWAVRRFLTRAAATDRRLPGVRQDGPPRISASVVGALLSCLLLVGLLAVHDGWSEHQRKAEVAHRHTAERALASLVLPAGTSRGAAPDPGCSASADTVCASSSRSVEELRPAMESLLGGRTSTVMCELVPQPKGMPCPVTVFGNIAGYPAVANVSRHLIIVREGGPPAGAVPLHPGSSRGIFFLGADIYVSLLAR